MSTKRWTFIAIIGCLLLSTVSLMAQVTANARLQGTIVDKSQAVIGQKAEVTLTNKDTGFSRTTKTNDSGEYRFESLQAGVYTVKVSAPGFSIAEAKNLEILVGSTATQNFTLTPGAVSETVEVTATAPLVDQTKTDVSTNITPQQITDLPLIGRDIADLAYLAPGVKAADSYDPTKNRYSILSVNGDGGRNVNVTVNGVDNKDNTVGGPVMQLPAEAVQEFQISTQRFSAVNGRSAGAAINVITKSGSNNFHGSAFGFFRDQALNADQKLANGDGTTTNSNPPYSRQWFGGSIGGPIKKDKLFAFFAYERQREHTSISEAPLALSELSLVTSLGAQPTATVPTPFFENRLNGRLDFTINNKHSAYFSVTTQANNSLNDQSNGFFDLTEGNFTVNHLQVANLTINSALTPTLINQFTFGFQYWNNLIDSSTRTPLLTFPKGVQFGTNTNVPQQSIQRKYQFKDDISKSIGRHTFKGGFDYIWTPVMGGFFEFNPTLELDFSLLPSQILALPQGFQTPGLLVGGNNSGGGMSIAVGDPTFIIKDAKQLGLYFQDDWKVSQRLTVNLGIRWDKDFDFIGGSDIGQSRTFQELQAAAAFSPLAASLVAKKANDYSKGFSPRVGLAYDLNGHGNHIVRAGFGMYYDNTFQNIPLFMEQQANQTIFQTAFSLSNASDMVPGTGIPLSAWHLGSPLPTIPAPSHNLAPGTSIGRLMDPNYRTPVTEEFNGGYTWAINSKSVFEAEYVHVLSLHENKTINVDPNIPVTPNNITTLSRTGAPGGFFRPLDAAFNAAAVPLLGSVRDETSGGRSRYDGMNLSFRQRSFHKTDLTVNYTLARAVGYNEDGGSFRYYPRDPQHALSSAEFGPAFNDERHHLTIAGTAHLPWGLEASPILQAGSARPYKPVSSNNMLNLGGGSDAGALIVTKADPKNLLSATTLPLVSGRLDVAEAACYYSGNCILAPYNGLRGDPYFNMDARLAKNIKLGENRKLQLIFQTFNLFNHANYGNSFDNLVATLNSTTHANATPNAGFNNPNNFINPTSSTLPRSFIAEFGARFSF
ncbi:MAG TPA: TonB-dependent receptor [Candidatus Angelobacter sp.]|nr:TonB-dependent receptor [Candidatus Angelobacter sp.]